jgi:hypothetical protein
MANHWLVVGHSEHYDAEEELNESAPGNGHIVAARMRRLAGRDRKAQERR